MGQGCVQIITVKSPQGYICRALEGNIFNMLSIQLKGSSTWQSATDYSSGYIQPGIYMCEISGQQERDRQEETRDMDRKRERAGECLLPSLWSLGQLYSPSSIMLWQGIFPVTQLCFRATKIPCSNIHIHASSWGKKTFERCWRLQSEALSCFSCCKLHTVGWTSPSTRLNKTSLCTPWRSTCFPSCIAHTVHLTHTICGVKWFCLCRMYRRLSGNITT